MKITNKRLNEVFVFVPGLLVGHKIYNLLMVRDFLKTKVKKVYIHARERGMDLSERADWLVRILDSELDGRKVHLFGHSAGGLDIRLALHRRPDLMKNVVSLTTCGTPHRGTPIADQYLRALKSTKIDQMLFGSDKAEIIAKQFTWGYLQEFADTVQTIEELGGDKVFCLPCSISKKWKTPMINWRGLGTLKIANDSTVTVFSQTYGKVIDYMDVDHKAATLPFRYGLSWKTYQDVFMKVIENCEAVERGEL